MEEKLKTQGMKRSPKWAGVRREWLKRHPKCFVCLGTEKVEVHHKKPFHLHPELELDPDNLITLCENKKGGINCHLAFGHLGSYKSVNINVKRDCEIWRKKLLTRPK